MQPEHGTALARSLWPLPGGATQYAHSLRTMLRLCRDAGDVPSLSEAIADTFPGVRSPASGRRYINLVLKPLGFVELVGSKVVLTQEGRLYASRGNKTLLATQLVTRISGVEEILVILEAGPQRIGVIHEQLGNMGLRWQSHWQVRYRLRWMEAAGLVQRRDYQLDNRTRQRYPEYVLCRRRGAAYVRGVQAGTT